MRLDQLNNFEDVVRIHQREVVNFLYRLVGNRFEAEDLAQDTFVKAYKKFNSIKDSEKVRSWLFSIARNNAVDFFRRKKEKNIALDNTVLENWAQDNAVEFSAHVINAELSKELQTCIATLNSEDQTIIRLLYFEGFSYKEIAELMRMNNNTLKSRLHRARKALLVAIKENVALKDIVVQYS
jgi:RNA polymerase sigma-70 factor, ECF subfamily